MVPAGAIFLCYSLFMNKLRILGIDPGFDRVGIAIIDKDMSKETLIMSTCIITSRKESFPMRVSQIARELIHILLEYKPQVLAIEKLFFTKNQTTAMAVAEMRGVIMYLAHEHRLTINEYSPPEIKLAVAGHGKADKHDISLMVKRILKCETTGKMDDEVDAIAIALTHSSHHKATLWKARQ